MKNIYVIHATNQWTDETYTELAQAHNPDDAEDMVIDIAFHGHEGVGVICIGMIGKNCETCPRVLNCTNRRV